MLVDLDSFHSPWLCPQGDVKPNETASEEPENEPKVTNMPSPNVEVDTQVIDQLPQVEAISKS